MISSLRILKRNPKRSYRMGCVFLYYFISLFIPTTVCDSIYSEHKNKNSYDDYFVKAYELLDAGEYTRSFDVLKECVHYDIRCLTLIGKFYYLGLKPVERDVCNALYIWKVASDYGSSDAQFYLGIMYSNYFSLPNLYSYAKASKEEENIEEGEGEEEEQRTASFLHKLKLWIISKGLHKNNVSEIWSKDTTYAVRQKKIKEQQSSSSSSSNVTKKMFRNIPVITFTKNNELILRIKNIKYNTEQLANYFHKLFSFPKDSQYSEIREDTDDEEEDEEESLDNERDKTRYRNFCKGNVDIEYLENEEKQDSKMEYERNHNLSLLYLYSSSLANHPGGILALGNKYMNGYGVEKNCEAALKYYLKLTNSIFNSDEKTEFEIIDLIRLSIPYYDKYNMINKKIKSIEILLETSLHDNHKLLTMIARRYLIGIDGVEKDYKKAYAYLKKAAKYRNAEALSLLGYMYLLGLGVNRDYKKASEYFIQGNKLNDSLSHNGLGYMHFFGLGEFKKNIHLAFYYFELAAKNNLSSAQFNLACMYLSGVGIDQSFQNAFYWFYKSLNNGNILAAYVIGFIHFNGVLVSRNCKLALSLLARIAENNSFILNTTNKIIRYNEKGRHSEALFLMALLAETGHLQSQINLSYKIYHWDFSLFLPSDMNSKKIYASRYLAMASEHNDFKSLYTLGDYAYNGHGVYIIIQPKNSVPIHLVYDVNTHSNLYKYHKHLHNSSINRMKKSHRKKAELKKPILLDNNNNKEKRKKKEKKLVQDPVHLGEQKDKIISTDFIDEDGSIFNDKWRFNYAVKFAFNRVDYKLAYHHYKSIISFYPSSISVIQTISRACFNLGYMYYYGIGVAKNIEKALVYLNSSMEIYPAYKAPSFLFILYIKFNKYLYRLRKRFQGVFRFIGLT